MKFYVCFLWGGKRHIFLISCARHQGDLRCARAPSLGSFLRGFTYRFIELCAKDLTEAKVRKHSGAPVEPDRVARFSKPTLVVISGK